MDMAVEVEDTHFRVTTQVFSFTWPDTPANRKVAVVVLRSLIDGTGRPLFTLQQVAQVVESANRQAAGQHLEDFRVCGDDFQAVLLRKRKVDAAVVEAVWIELQHESLVPTEELCRRGNAHVGRTALSAANSEAALEQLSCAALRRVLHQQLAQGRAHYQEGYLLDVRLRTCEAEEGRYPGIEVSPLRRSPGGGSIRRRFGRG